MKGKKLKKKFLSINHKISRRDFIFGLASTAVLLRIGGCAHDIKDTISLSTLTAQIPRFLFFPECHPKHSTVPSYCNVSPVSIRKSFLDRTKKTITIIFSNGQKRIFLADSSYSSAVGTAAFHDCIILKSLASWILDAVYNSIRSKKKYQSYLSARKDFDALQEQHVLESVSPGALHRFLSDFRKRKTINKISWDKKNAAFLIK